MPCDSRISRTQMTDSNRLEEALRAVGLTPVVVPSRTLDTFTTEEGLTFSRRQASDPYVASGNISRLSEVGKKYAEIGMRQWARKNGLLVRSVDEKGATLVSVRR